MNVEKVPLAEMGRQRGNLGRFAWGDPLQQVAGGAFLLRLVIHLLLVAPEASGPGPGRLAEGRIDVAPRPRARLMDLQWMGALRSRDVTGGATLVGGVMVLLVTTRAVDGRRVESRFGPLVTLTARPLLMDLVREVEVAANRRVQHRQSERTSHGIHHIP